MLKLTKKADYGLIAMKHLTLAGARSASAKEISESYGIPLPVLSKVLQKLTREHLLVSEHGTFGGYRLARGPEDINAFDVVRAIDGPIFLASCFSDDCEHSGRCNVRDPLRRIHEGIIELLEKMTLRELASENRAPLSAHNALRPRLHILNQ
jgi:Rrf2 family protein